MTERGYETISDTTDGPIIETGIENAPLPALIALAERGDSQAQVEVFRRAGTSAEELFERAVKQAIKNVMGEEEDNEV